MLRIEFIRMTAILVAANCIPSFPLFSQAALNNPIENQAIELGAVHWLRDFDAGVEKSNKTNKPILILFQEVPGCATCRNYGNQVLSHPLIVEAIESLFVPVAIFNNKDGKDRKTLELFNEPSWNNPVIRITNQVRGDLVPRLSGNYTLLGLVNHMIDVLNQEGNEIPGYLKLFREELAAAETQTETAVLSMYCFWSGEKKLGQLEGVVETAPGFMQGREVVKVVYNPSQLSFPKLLSYADQQDCASYVFSTNDTQGKTAKKKLGNNRVMDASNFRIDVEPKYYLSKTIYKYVPMTAMQATKLNSLITSGGQVESILSPRQLEVADYIKKHPEIKWPDQIHQDIRTGWKRLTTLNP